MPVVRKKTPDSRDELVEQILKELLEEGTYDGPVIFEVDTPEPNILYVIVVWEAWRGIAASERSAIVVAAYDKLAGILGRNTFRPKSPSAPLRFPSPTSSTALGATYAEVVESRLLPYGLRPVSVEGVGRFAQIQEAIRPLGALPGAPALDLLLPTREMRDEAYEKLVSRFPDIHFERFELPEAEE